MDQRQEGVAQSPSQVEVHVLLRSDAEHVQDAEDSRARRCEARQPSAHGSEHRSMSFTYLWRKMKLRFSGAACLILPHKYKTVEGYRNKTWTMCVRCGRIVEDLEKR